MKTEIVNVTSSKKRAATYRRVSTDEQAKNGISLDIQKELTKLEAEKDGYEVVAELEDDGKSGGTLNRAGIRGIIRLVTEQKIDAVYSVHSDRIARNALDYLTLRELFRKNNVILKCIYQPMTDESATSRGMDTVLAGFSEMQRLVTSERVKGTLYEKAKAGYFPTAPPPGYKNIDNPDASSAKIAKKIITIDDEAAPLVQEMFRLFATGQYSGDDLSDIMYEKGLRTRKTEKRKGGGRLSRSQLLNGLRNPIYIGKVSWGPIKDIEGKHQPLIEPYLFNQVQGILASHNKHACRRRKYKWLLNGFLYCYSHERRYTAEWHLNKSIAYYHCTYRSGCGKYAEVNELEAKVADKFKELEFTPEFIDSIIAKAKAIFYERRQGYEKKRKGLVNQRTAYEEKIRTLEEQLMERQISGFDFNRLKDSQLKEIASIDEKLATLERGHTLQVDIAQAIMRFTENIYESYKLSSPALKRHYLGFFWSKFEVKEGLIIKSNPSLLFDSLLKLQHAILKTSEKPKAKGAIISNKVMTSNILLPEQDAVISIFSDNDYMQSMYNQMLFIKAMRRQEVA